jgi:hypothetical protein
VSAGYSLVVVCGWATWRFTRRSLKAANKARARDLNRQIMLNLSIQVIFPLI